MVERGKFIVIEGGSGSGKSTQIRLLKKKLKNGWRFYREPGSTKFGEKIRDAVQGLHNYKVDEYAALFAYSAARANLIRKIIIPKLDKGINIILDRYWYSTFAYQGTGVKKGEIEQVSKIATDNLKPNLVIFYDVEPEVGIKRKSKNKDADRYDFKDLEFHKKVRKNYGLLSKKLMKIWVTIDGSNDIKTVEKETFKALKKFKMI
jgi:dTMP kinase